MEFKCKAGMMDCDGDRRAFAKKQWAEFLERDGPAPKEKNLKKEEAK